MTEHVANIGERGARRRWISGYVWSVISAAAFALLVIGRAPHWTRLLLVIPIGLAATGFLQAREKT